LFLYAVKTYIPKCDEEEGDFGKPRRDPRVSSRADEVTTSKLQQYIVG
jgi:hypothetical protein